MLILHVGSIDGAIGEIVGGCTFEEIDLIVTGRGRSVVPILSVEVVFEVAAVEIDDARWSLIAHSRRQAVLSIESGVEMLDVGVG